MKPIVYVPWILTVLGFVVSFILYFLKNRSDRKYQELQEFVREASVTRERQKVLFERLDKIADGRLEIQKSIYAVHNILDNTAEDKNSVMFKIQTDFIHLLNQMERLAFMLNHDFFDADLVRSQVLPILKVYFDEFMTLEKTLRDYFRQRFIGHTKKSLEELKKFTVNNLSVNDVSELNEKAEEFGLYHWNLNYYRKKL